jgi:glycosyltransferase EpsD
MRVLQVATIDRSVDAFLVPHIRALESVGHSVEAACRIGDSGNRLHSKGIVVHNIGFERNPFDIGNIAAYRQMCELIRANRYDIVHAHMPTAGGIARLAAAAVGVPVILYTAHGFYFYEGGNPLLNYVYYFIERNLARLTTAIITINSDDYQAALKWTGAGKRPYVYRMPCVGIDLAKFDRAALFQSDDEWRQYRAGLGIAPNDLVVGTVGACTARKRHSDLIRAIALVQPDVPDLKVLIVGDGALLEKEKSLASRLKCSCIFTGRRLDVPRLLACIDVYVQTSAMEGLPVSVVEAMASGLPVIASNVRGNRDLVLDGETGFLFPVSDVQQLAARLKCLLPYSDLCIEMGRKAIARVGDYDQEGVCQQLLEIYAEVASRVVRPESVLR